ncbi:MAG: hypothetical protein KF851_03965 [Pirellulaceae bacterium]|nr:hypothetical protein [Pirellulaceae bacterium]
MTINPSPSARGELNEIANRLVNVPLRRHDKEAARALENLYEDLILDVSQMSPEAAAYVRKRPWMTPELMRKWGCGWIPECRVRGASRQNGAFRRRFQLSSSLKFNG